MVTIDTIYRVKDIYEKIYAGLDDVLIGQSVVKKAVTSSLLCDKNSKILLTGGTGYGKTSICNYLRSSFDNLRFSITSDMLPSEIQEVLIANPNFRFLYLDELNRGSGKLHGSLLELYEEGKITYEGRTYEFPEFYAFATQNNADISGIFSVPEAMYDRTHMNIYTDFLTSEEKESILFSGFESEKQSHISQADIDYTTRAVANFDLEQEDIDLLMKIFNKIDSLCFDGHNLFSGSNIRAHKYAIRLAKINAMSEGRGIIKPSDLSDYITFLYLHRINQNVVSLANPDVRNLIDRTSREILTLKRAKTIKGKQYHE